MIVPTDLAPLPTAVRRYFAGVDGRLRLALVLGLTAGIEGAAYRPDWYPDSAMPAVVLNVLAVAPIVVAFWYPFLAAAGAALALLMLLGWPEVPVTVTALGVFAYALGNLVMRRHLAFVVPLALPFLLNAVEPIDGDGATAGSTVGPLLLFTATVLVAEARRKRQDTVVELGETRVAMAASAREQTVMEERARIARELHDIIAHHLSVIAIQSETARLTSPRLSKDAKARFEEIGGTAREALTETRRLLGVLRDDADAAERTPQPGLEQLAGLVETARGAGASVALGVEGSVRPLSPGVDLAAFRIVQEALTNARRHAPGADVDVHLSYGADALRIRVRDHGSGIQPPDDAGLVEGHGLVGMRDRAAIAGGTFSCGPAEGGGWVVDAVLPIAGGEPA